MEDRKYLHQLKKLNRLIKNQDLSEARAYLDKHPNLIKGLFDFLRAQSQATPQLNELQNLVNSLLELISPQDNKIEVKKGKVFKVTLSENLSTGFSWQAQVTPGLTILEDKHIQDEDAPIGAPGKHIWIIRATGQGKQIFNAVYRKGEEVAQRYRLIVNII